MFECFINDLASDTCVNYTKRPFGGSEQVIKYISQHTHRAALCKKCLISIKNNSILL